MLTAGVNRQRLLIIWLSWAKSKTAFSFGAIMMNCFNFGFRDKIKTSMKKCGSNTAENPRRWPMRMLQKRWWNDKNRLFIHAGFTNINGIEYEYFPKVFYWDRTLWETALALNENLDTTSVFYPKRLTLYKEIYIGHTPVTKIGATVPVQKACVWNVDTGAAFEGPLTIMNIYTKEFWQSEPLNELYFNEKGRN